MLESLERFLKEAVGLRYSVRPSDVFRRVTKTKRMEAEDTLVPNSRTFFCSELIAKAYKVLKLI